MKEYLLSVRVTDDGIGDPHDDAVANEYVSRQDIVDEIETLVTTGLKAKVESIEEVVKDR